MMVMMIMIMVTMILLMVIKELTEIETSILLTGLSNLLRSIALTVVVYDRNDVHHDQTD